MLLIHWCISQSSPESQDLWMSLYIEVIYCDDLKPVVQLTQQWSAVSEKSKNLVVAQSMRLVVSAGLLYKLES